MDALLDRSQASDSHIDDAKAVGVNEYLRSFKVASYTVKENEEEEEEEKEEVRIKVGWYFEIDTLHITFLLFAKRTSIPQICCGVLIIRLYLLMSLSALSVTET